MSAEDKAAEVSLHEALRDSLGVGKAIGRVDRTGKAMSEGDWSEANQDPEYVRVAHDAVGDVVVSTVWIGIDDAEAGFGDEPQIFETMVIDDRRDQDVGVEVSTDELRRRYRTEDEALRGHSHTLGLVRLRLSFEDEDGSPPPSPPEP